MSSYTALTYQITLQCELRNNSQSTPTLVIEMYFICTHHIPMRDTQTFQLEDLTIKERTKGQTKLPKQFCPTNEYLYHSSKIGPWSWWLNRVADGIHWIVTEVVRCCPVILLLSPRLIPGKRKRAPRILVNLRQAIWYLYKNRNKRCYSNIS